MEEDKTLVAGTSKNASVDASKVETKNPPKPPVNKSSAANRLFKPTAASVAKSKNAPPPPRPVYVRQPVKPVPQSVMRPVRPVAQSAMRPPPTALRPTTQQRTENPVQMKRGQRTPNNKPNSRVISTPTSDEVKPDDTALDAWDASEIHVINRTQLPGANMMDETAVGLSIVRNLGLDYNKISQPPPRTGAKMKPPLMPNKVPATVAKMSASRGEKEDPDSISDKQIDMSYYRYLQSMYINTVSLAAQQKAEQENESSLLSAWSLLETTRQDFLKAEEEKNQWELISDMQETLGKISESIRLVLEDRGGVSRNLEDLSSALERVKHNLPVSGMNVSDRETEMADLQKLFTQFRDQVKGYEGVIGEDAESAGAMAQVCRGVSVCTTQSLEMAAQCDALLRKCEHLAIREASLNISLAQLDAEEARQNCPRLLP